MESVISKNYASLGKNFKDRISLNLLKIQLSKDINKVTLEVCIIRTAQAEPK